MSELADRAPLVAALRNARAAGLRPMQIPGHKYRYLTPDSDAVGSEILYDIIRDDVALQGGADDNSFSNGYLPAAEALYAQAIGAAHTRFLVGGSSQGNIAALLTVGRDGARIAVDRTSHRSALSGLVLSGAVPEWIYPEIHPEFGLPVGVGAAALAGVSACEAVFVTSPAYVGTMTDVAAIAAVTRAAGQTLIVDQAWGAHLDFGVAGYPSALATGADIVVTSVHKALMGYSQTAVISCRESIDFARLDRAVDSIATTSPSATLFASIDATRAVMVSEGAAALEKAAEIASAARIDLRKIAGVVVVDSENAGCAVDPLKIVLWLPRTGVTGTHLAAELWKHGVGVETSDFDTVVMTVSVADRPDDVAASVRLIEKILHTYGGTPRQSMSAAVWRTRPDVRMTPRAAAFAPRRRVRLSDAVGLISAEQFVPYPPGVPLLGPGELVTRDIVEAIEIAGTVGRVAYNSDRSLGTIEVVAE